MKKIQRAMFVDTGEIFEYYHSAIDGLPTTIIKRERGFTRYYTDDVVATGVAEGWLKLIEEEDEQA